MHTWLRRTIGIGVPAVVAAGTMLGLSGCAASAWGGSSTVAQGSQGSAQTAGGSSASAITLPSAGSASQAGQGSGGAPSGQFVTATPPGPDLPTPTLPAASPSAGLNLAGIFKTAPATLHFPIVDLTPGPTGVIGDSKVPCLEGYVWRQAYSGDYVCVTPAQRTQAQNDNAAAASRRSPDGGAYGPETCVQGYVWRQVVTNDDVCVTPAERAQVQADNALAGKRIAYLNLWISDWYPPQPAPSCDGDVCTSSDGGGGPQIQLDGDAFNQGLVLLEIRSNGGQVLWHQVVASTQLSSYPGFVVAAQSTQLDCSGDPGAKTNAYAVAFDYASGRWSAEVPVKSACANF